MKAETFTSIVSRLRPRLLNLALQFQADADAAEDAVQEALMRLWIAWENLPEAADAERIFEPYTKLNQYFDGEGVGLTVARNIAQRLGGELTLDAEYAGPGCRFVLQLPI